MIKLTVSKNQSFHAWSEIPQYFLSFFFLDLKGFIFFQTAEIYRNEATFTISKTFSFRSLIFLLFLCYELVIAKRNNGSKKKVELHAFNPSCGIIRLKFMNIKLANKLFGSTDVFPHEKFWRDFVYCLYFRFLTT